ncbi:MAG: helix-turn-helix transcriptional regulator, partial [Rhizobacter sp.]|nr:helix-turn-helix transcriptional regulator [Rhizobacter sp.]
MPVPFTSYQPAPANRLARPAAPTASDNLLATKINAPTTTPEQVLRTAICEVIATSSTAKLVLVRAPAGFGKTTSMVQARARLAAAGVDTAWLTLDRADNDASRFLSCLAMTLARMVGEPVVPRAPLEAVERLASHDTPFVLFLDEFEVIQEPAVLSLVREIIDHLPRRGQLVIGSRSLPDLGLGRLRARGQLIEIDTEDLRFSVEETSEFFRLRQTEPVPAEALVRLHHKTEGWVA